MYPLDELVYKNTGDAAVLRNTYIQYRKHSLAISLSNLSLLLQKSFILESVSNLFLLNAIWMTPNTHYEKDEIKEDLLRAMMDRDRLSHVVPAMILRLIVSTRKGGRGVLEQPIYAEWWFVV